MARRAAIGVGAMVSVLAWMQPLTQSFAAEATSAEHDLQIERQPLARALQEFAKQSGVQIIFFSSIAAGREAEPLHGRFTTEAALERMLNDPRLTFRQIHANTIEICLKASVACGLTPSQPNSESEMKQNASSATVAADRNRRLRRTRTVSGALLSAAAMAAAAQTDSTAGLEEVVVTAQKRTERLQDVPLAVTAISGEMLANANINDTNSLVNMTPSLTYTQGANVVNTNFRIRGIGTSVFGPGLEPSVSVVVDGVVMARAGQGFADLADVERVEVLRGPQGTLFGKNAIGGLINVVTKAPSDTFTADADVTVAEGDEYRVRGTMSGPLSDTLGARLTAYYNDVGGHVRNVTLGRDVSGFESMGVRGKLQWDVSDLVELRFLGDYRKMDSDCCSSTVLSLVNPLYQSLLLPVVPSFNNREEAENVVTYNNTEQAVVSLEASFNFDAVTVTSLTAYQDFSFVNNQPVDRLNTPVPLYLPVTNGQFDINGAHWDIGQLTQEVRIASVGTNRLNYVAGIYLLDLDLDFGFDRRQGNCAPGGTPAAFGQPCLTSLYRSQGGMRSNTQTQNAAVFGQVDFGIVGGLSALAGARVQYEEVSYEGERPDQRLVAGDLPLQGITASSGSGKSDDVAVTGKVGLKYEFSDDLQTYLTWSRGYKGAGYHTGFEANFVDQVAVRPETAKSWELGLKSQLFDGLMTLNTAVFRADYEDLQVQANRGNPDLGIILFAPTNAGSAMTEGIEVEFAAQPFDSWHFSGGVTYLSTSVDANGLNCILPAQATAPVVTGTTLFNTCYRVAPGGSPIQNIRGGDLPSSPRWRGNLSVRYEADLPGTEFTGFVQLAGNAQSESNFVIEQDPIAVQDAYTIVDASLGVRHADGYRVTFFVRNLFDEHYVTSLGRASTLTTSTVTPDNLTGTIPKEANRYYGVTVGVSF